MEDRKCTDVFCSIIFILVWAANIVIAVFAVGQGDLDSYFYGTDYQAQYCGKPGTDTSRTWNRTVREGRGGMFEIGAGEGRDRGQSNQLST